MSEELDRKKHQDFYNLLDNLFRARGLDFSQYRPKCIERRIKTRMLATKTNSYTEYLSILRNNPGEYDKLLNALTINVTEFFRDGEVFEYIRRKVLPEIIKNKEKRQKKVIRIWSAGCADGPEPYTLAILAFEVLGERLYKDFFVNIYGTDIDEDCLRRAQEGVYAKNTHIKNVPLNIIQKYFTYVGDNKYAVNDRLRIITKFRRHDLVLDKPLNYIDLVVCRNALIYFSRQLQEKVFMNFHKGLARDGFMVLGKIETVSGPAQGMFDLIDLQNKVYKVK